MQILQLDKAQTSIDECYPKGTMVDISTAMAAASVDGKKRDKKDGDKIIKLSTQEGEEVEVKKKVIKWSVLVKGVLDDGGDDSVVPLPSVSKPVLEKVIKYLEYITVEEGQPKKKPKIKCPLVDADLKNSIEDKPEG